MLQRHGKLLPFGVKNAIISNSWAPSLSINDRGNSSMREVSTFALR
jgi:hypothetical protein